MTIVLAACGGDNGGSSATTTSPSTAPTTTASDRCHTNELSATLGPPDPGAGNVYYALVFENTGTRTCAMAGYPGVSLLDPAGAQIGAPATREAGLPTAEIKLAPGAHASTALHTLNGGVAAGGCLPPSAKVRIFPPNELDAIEIAGKVTVCGNTFSVSPVVAGTTGR